MKVLLSIKPEFVQEIFTGKKKYEYRKVIFTRSVDKVVVYSTKPVGMIVGEFTVENILMIPLVHYGTRLIRIQVSLRIFLTNTLKVVHMGMP